MSIYSRLSRYAAAWRAHRDEIETRRVLGSLPTEILKDIGWPEAAGRPARRTFTTSWGGN